MGFWGDLVASLMFDRGGVLETMVNTEEEILDKIGEDIANKKIRDENEKISDVPNYSEYDVTKIHH